MARRTSPCPRRPSIDLTFDQIFELLERPAREASGLFWAEGCRPFLSALEHGWSVRAVVYCPKLLRSRYAWEALRLLSYAPLRVSPEQFKLLSRRLEPDGIGVVCDQRWSRLIEQHPRPGDVWIGLDTVRTPGNLGAILRTCAAAGARGALLIGGEIDPYDPAAIRSSMGAIFGTKLVRTSARALDAWKSHRTAEGLHQVRFVGTSPGATLDYRQAQYQTPLVLLMGGERQGLRERQVALCDQVVRLPMTDQVDSLNVAVATSLVLYEAIRDAG
jgi:TrmH family RNA methyltransferase